MAPMRNTRFLLVLILSLTTLSTVEQAVAQQIEWKTKQLSKDFYSEGATVGDFNQDGHPDVASGPFWFAGPDFEQSHQFYAQDSFDPHGYSNNFFAYTQDFNQDGWEDILIFGFPGNDASWYENPKNALNPDGAQRFWPRHQVLDLVDNESPTFTDLDGDGSRDIVCSVNGFFGFASINSDAPETPWKFQRISDKSAGGKFTHGLGVGDIDGDGKADLLTKNGWWEQPKSLKEQPTWKWHASNFAPGTGSAQMFAYDVDGDGDNDVVCSLHAHGYGLAWFESDRSETTPPTNGISFTKHLIMGSSPQENAQGLVFSQLHAVELVDINGDGLKDILTGKRYWAHGPEGDVDPAAPAVLYWFELQREKSSGTVKWIPHLIHDDSGVGTEVNHADLNGDQMIDVIVGNKKGTFVHWQQRRSPN